MKRFFSITVLLALLLTLVACSGKAEAPKLLEKEGIAPYTLSESEKYLLQSLDLEGNSQIISFHAPKEAKALNLNVYRLEEGQQWSNIGGGGISLDADQEANDSLIGTFTMQLKEDYSIDFVINAGGKATYKTEAVVLDSEILTSTKGFLQEAQDIILNEEIPVALMVYDSGTTMRSYTPQDYFEPEKFAEMDLVQVVTLEFSDNMD